MASYKELRAEAASKGHKVIGLKKADLEALLAGAENEAKPQAAVAASRKSANTWWCGNCGAGNRVGAADVCGNCGTPLKVA